MSNKRKLKGEKGPELTLPGPSHFVAADAQDKVAIGYLFEDEIKSSFFHCFLGLLGHDSDTTNRIIGFVQRRGTTGDLAGGRNEVVLDFLASPAQWLFWVDTDMGFEPDTVERLLEAADPIERPAVGALCFAQREHISDGVGGWRPEAWPTVMDWNVIDGRGGFEVRYDYPRNTLTRVGATGSACILIHRSVFERVRDDYENLQRERGRRNDGDDRWSSWYSRVTNQTTGQLMGEDLSFCARLLRLEIPVHVHTGVQTTHQKHIWLQEEDYWRQRALTPAPATTPPVPADERAAYRVGLITTHNRPELLRDLVASLSTQVDHLIVLDNASDPPVGEGLLEAAKPATIGVMLDDEQPPHLSRFWNDLLGMAEAHAQQDGHETWDVAVFNDDCIVPAGWFDACSAALRGHEKAVVAHTGTVAIHREELVDSHPYERHRRMCPWAFVAKGEVGLRADESMRWWFFDDDFNRQAIDAGGVLAVPGPLVVNAHASQSTVGELAEQAERDRKVFAQKWGES